jgi:hypothetical protein
MMRTKCNICSNYLNGVDRCKYCEFEYDEEYNPCRDDDWDILDLDDNEEWSHLQIMDRLLYKGIKCYEADIWWNRNMAYLLGCDGKDHEIASALGIHEEIISNSCDGLIILNLFQEKYLRGELDES